MKKMSLKLGIASLALLASMHSHATIIFSQGYTGTTPDAPVNSSQSDFTVPFQTADNFSVTSDADLGLIRWAGVYSPSTALPDDFTVRLFADVGGLPELAASILDINIGSAATRTAASGVTLGSRQVFNYEYTLGTPISLTTGTNYWLSVVNNVSGVDQFWNWTSSADDIDAAAGRGIDTDAWSSRLGAYQFQLEDVAPVPVPAAFWLLASGLAGLAFQRRRKP